MSSPDGRRPGVVGPIILIGLGVLLLLNNLQILPWSVWDSLLHLWPILLIALGIEIVLGRHSFLGSLIAVVLVIGLLLAAVGSYVPWWPWGQEWVQWAAPGPMATERVSQPLGGASQAEVQLSFGVGRVRVGTLDDATLLVDGQVALTRGERLDRDFALRGTTAHLTLRQDGARAGRFWLQRGERGDQPTWDLRLNKSVPMRLKINTGAGLSEINLADLMVRNLDVNTGVGKTNLTLPGHGQVVAEISSGVGETTVSIPTGMAARVRVRTGIGTADVLGNFERRGDDYVSPGYDSASERIDLQVKGGVGKITVRSR